VARDLQQPSRWLEALPLQGLSRFLFWNTLWLGVLTAFFSTIFGVAVGAASARGIQRARTLITTLSVLPLGPAADADGERVARSFAHAARAFDGFAGREKRFERPAGFAGVHCYWRSVSSRLWH
jgi:hypothetical protein